MSLKRRVPPVVLPDISETPEEEKIFSGEPDRRRRQRSARGGAFFVLSPAISAFAAKSILTYNGGGFFRHTANQLKQLFGKHIPKGL